jgi:hypothetical protein
MRTTLLFAGLCLTVPTALAADNEHRLALQVSPIVAMAPANVTIRAMIDSDDDNRVLEVTVESDAFRRSSQIPLDGKHAPRLNVVELRGIPTGLYEVRAVLVGPSGPRASSLKLVRIEPAAGRR